MSYARISTRNEYGMRRSYSHTLGRAIVLAVPPGPAEPPARTGGFTTRALSGAERRLRVLYGLGDATQATVPTAQALTSTTDFNRYPTPPLRIVEPIEIVAPVRTAPAPSSSTPVAAPAPGSPYPSNQPSISAAPIPPNTQAAYPGQTYTDPATGNVWAWNTSEWVLIQPGASTQPGPTPSTSANQPPPSNVALQSTGGGATAQAGTPVPVGYPTNQAYTDSSGNIWTYTATGGWQITGTSSSPATANNWAASITSWLNEQTIISGISNFWVVGGAAAIGLVLKGMFEGRRR